MTNETLDTLMKRETAKNGYIEFVMYDFEGLETPLEETVMERLIDKLVHVEYFTVAGMSGLPTAVRLQLLLFAVTVLEEHKSPMKRMNFNGIIDD